jgi:hypothetical protein
VTTDIYADSWVNQHGEPGVDTHALGSMCLSISIDLCFLKEQLSRHSC